MAENKILQISPEDAKYIDPAQIASIQMIDGTNVIVKGNEEDGFVEETQQDEQQYQTQDVQAQQQPQNLRGRGILGALAGAAGVAARTAGRAALIGTAAALSRPYYGYGYRYPYRPMMMYPPPPPMYGPMMRPMMRPLYF